MTKTFTEKELLEGLDAQSTHADELAKPLPKERAHLEKLNRSVLRYERPLDPCGMNF
ncbi:hypothetical protein [Marinobacter sp. NFXS9]|uniref:hypothetical protein n=1 Tax=Marinobacter sp. NFXS9 TaxID=2818433 RepID=UPI0032DED2E0